MTRLVTFGGQRGAAVSFPSGQQQPTAIFEFDNTYPEEATLRVSGSMAGTGELKAECGSALVSLGTGTGNFDEEIILQGEGDHIKFISDDFVGTVTSLTVVLQ